REHRSPGESAVVLHRQDLCPPEHAVFALTPAVPHSIAIQQHAVNQQQRSCLRASDGACYVTKFQNNPQHIRVLANEMLATNLGRALGLSMPRVEVIEVSDWLIERTEDLRISLGGAKIPCRSGKQLGSLYVGCESPAMTFDYLPRELLQGVRNLTDFARVLVLDKWTCNSDGRQAIFWKARTSQRYTATFIDQGYCFNAGEWTFPDSPLRGAYANNCVYEGVMGWEAFEPALSRAEEMDAQAIWRCAADIPEEWYEGDRDGLNRLVETLHHRRPTIRKLIGEVRRSNRKPFPNWRESPADSAIPLAATYRSLEVQPL
ncbi:MAG: HipA family kinase, partial [Candidatus Sulfotelmatobacter sp.]